MSCNPSENEESMSVADKNTMLNPENRNKPTASKTRTPIQSGRSSTHGDTASNSTEETFIGNKPQNNFTRRTPGRPSVNPTSYKRPSSALPVESMKLENQYMLKKKRFMQLRKDLFDKQKYAQDLYNEMSQLREKLLSTGAKDPGKMKDVKVEVGSLKQSTAENKEQIEVNLEKLAIGNEFMESLERHLQQVPKGSRNICRELLDKQTEFACLIASHFANDSETVVETDKTNDSVRSRLEEFQKDCDDLRNKLIDIEKTEASSLAELSKNVCDLVNQYESYRTQLKELKVTESQKELEAQLNAVIEELQVERETNNQNKERVRETETKLQKARTKIRDLESRVVNDEGTILQLQANVKNLETQMKQKEQSMDIKLKEMQKTMKASKSLIDKVEKQRDSFETRLVELKEKMSSKENDALNTIQELSEKLNAATNEVEVEKVKRQEAEEAFSQLEERYKNLEEKSQQLCELAEKNKDFTITEGSHTDNEVRLFKQLQETREELEVQKQMMLQLQHEKEEIIAVMHQAASQVEEENSKEKLAAELVYKSNELQNLMTQYSELKKVAKNAQERNGTLENQLMAIQNRLHSQLKEGGKAGLSAHAIELQQQVSDLRNNLAELVRQKEELETALTQKQLELEQRDRVMREQSKFLKVRDELLEILKGKAQQENGDISNSDENNKYLNQITAKTEAIQELCVTLENKQRQIMSLEKMVKLMEDQQDRSQAQRTRLENRIAQLELTLQNRKEQRSKGFGIL